MNNQVIPAEAVAAAVTAYINAAHPVGLAEIEAILEAAAPHMPQQVSVIHGGHDAESHARSFNEGYETAKAQDLADDPSLAQDWLAEKLAGAWERGRDAEFQRSVMKRQTDRNPYRPTP